TPCQRNCQSVRRLPGVSAAATVDKVGGRGWRARRLVHGRKDGSILQHGPGAQTLPGGVRITTHAIDLKDVTWSRLSIDVESNRLAPIHAGRGGISPELTFRGC